MAMQQQPNKDPRVKITIDASESERTFIKVLAAKNRMTISDFIMSYVRPHIPQASNANRSRKEPNAKTLAALREAEEGRNLATYNSVEEFWEAMGIDPNAKG